MYQCCRGKYSIIILLYAGKPYAQSTLWLQRLRSVICTPPPPQRRGGDGGGYPPPKGPETTSKSQIARHSPILNSLTMNCWSLSPSTILSNLRIWFYSFNPDYMGRCFNCFLCRYYWFIAK